VHNVADDVWVSALGNVYNLTSAGLSVGDPLVRFAGTDVTHWFNTETRQVGSDPSMIVVYPDYRTDVHLFHAWSSLS
jgi:hypothetical protein